MKITFVDGDDWKGLYIDGKLFMEGHELTIYDVLDAIDVKYKYIEPDLDWLAHNGSLPEKLSDVKKGK